MNSYFLHKTNVKKPKCNQLPTACPYIQLSIVISFISCTLVRNQKTMPNSSSNDFIELDANLAEGMESFLIEAVRQRPFIYKQSDKPRTKASVEKLNQTWDEISDELNVEVESCKTLWTCIKQKFIKYRKRKQHGESMHREWPAYEGLLEWLDEHIKKRR